ncbi:mycofactocin dehydrogenase MftG [Pseudonocardia asaccharolytica]|uniref:Putative dehydrogenase (Glucose-methanol-choline oxidoreductase) n=1 Tax=Pseudonocardia asaccharolytica DSM 44247 = NBRC 16224 TaxID=1123024 RepID=A0A511CVE4_9PSEU|nr:mycofactocin system GMC family oxidoreductase MftG [Pseudonocardia asaccharolytica]GEL16521.1 putative dehydrogenase (glucose-methanol-choline oxidoreductase) [Pseudonocardia asaccharolytica DSM 44247 = NBRC 16224]
MPGQRFDVVIVGGGSAGCVLAARLSEDPGRRVLLLEAGPAPRRVADFPSAARDVTSLAATAAAHALNWAYPVELVPGRADVVARGRILGGSGAINGGYFIRATPTDADGWGIPGWTFADLLPAYVRSERDLDRTGPGHGDRGPIPVRRPADALRSPTTDPFLEAAARLGFPAEPDKNAGGSPGAGPVPSNAVDGLRVSAAIGYLLPVLDRPNLCVRGDTPVVRVLLDDDRAVGVETQRRVVEAGEVVLAAGAVNTPHLLLLSGIGPADDLRAAGIEVRHDRPGVGRNWSDHPAVFVGFRPRAAAAPHPHAVTAQAALHLDSGADPAGDLEILLFTRPFVDGGPLHLMCALQAPRSRGVLTVTSPDPAARLRIRQRYLRDEADRRRLRHAVRIAAGLLRAGLGERDGLDGWVLGVDHRLDGWLRERLTTSAHLCGSAAMGPAGDPEAVVDGRLRVHGIDALRVVDTSVLSVVPRRGPAATAIALGERAAALGWGA